MISRRVLLLHEEGRSRPLGAHRQTGITNTGRANFRFERLALFEAQTTLLCSG